MSEFRIAWVVPGFEGAAAEPGIPALSGLARTLGRNHALRVLAVRYPPRSERYRLGGVHVQSFGHATPPHAQILARRAASVGRWTQVVKALAALHRRSPFAVIHGFWATESGMLAAVAGRLLGVPVLVSCCGGELASVCPAAYGSRLHRRERAQVALTLHLATRIGVGSADLGRRLRQRYPWLAGRIDVLPLGYDPAIFAPPRPSAQQREGRIICVASWSPVKGHDLLLDAMRLLMQRGVVAHLVLVGERTDDAAARAAVARRGLDGRVSLVGAVPQGRVAALLATAHVAAIASWHEAECLAVVEALACGVPVVSTPVGIARELLRDPLLGSCLAERSPLALADALCAWLQSASVGDGRTQAARRQAVAHLALPHVAERFLDTYQMLANGGRAERSHDGLHHSPFQV